MIDHVKLCKDCPTVIFMLASSWCGPCQLFKSCKDILLAQDNILNLRVNQKLHYINYEQGPDDAVQQAFGIPGYPTILVFSPITEKFVKYKGEREPEHIIDFASAYHKGELTEPVDLWKTVPKVVYHM
jgi:thiol-disulfide isomerase/thioredoxin